MNRFRLGAILVAGCAFLSCHTPLNVEEIARKVDKIGRKLDEYGTVSVSSPLFIDQTAYPEDLFAFNLDKSDDDYYKDAREDVHGRMAALFQQAAETRVGVQAQLDIQELILNRIKLERFHRAEEAFIRGQRFNDLAEYLNLVVPLIDPALAPSVGDALDADVQPDEEPPGEPSEEPSEELSEEPAEGPTGVPAAPGETPASKVLPEERVNRLRGLIEALRSASTGLSGAAEEPPELPEFTPVTTRPWAADLLPDTEEVKQVLAHEAKFMLFQELLGMINTPSTQPVVPNRSAIITAGGDTTVEGILRFLGKPELARQFRDKVVLIGVSMVSCTPGTRTERGYSADVSVAVSYDYQPARPQLLEELLEMGDDHTQRLVDSYVELANDEIVNRHSKLKELDGRIHDIENQMRSLSDRAREVEEPSARAKIKAENEKLSQQRGDLKESRRHLIESIIRSEVDRISKAADTQPYRQYRRPRAPAHLAGQDGLRLFDVSAVGSGAAALVPSLAEVPPAPVVAAVSPMTDVQTLDLATSIRRQQAFALRLALLVSGFGGEAQAAGLHQYIKQLQQDAVTRTPMNTVAGYSNSGGVFGYQIGPSLVGLSGAAGAGRGFGRPPGPAMVLQRQSFPALVFVGIDHADLRLKLRYEGVTKTWMIVEPRLQFRQTTRWIPLEGWLVDSRGAVRGGPQISEADRVRWANELRQAMNAVDQLDFECDGSGLGNVRGDKTPYDVKDTPADAAFKDFVRSRIAVLHAHMLEAYHFQAVPITAFVGPLNATDLLEADSGDTEHANSD